MCLLLLFKCSQVQVPVVWESNLTTSNFTNCLELNIGDSVAPTASSFFFVYLCSPNGSRQLICTNPWGTSGKTTTGLHRVDK